MTNRKKKYEELQGLCKEVIEEGRCVGCNRLEDEEFRGVYRCIYADREKGVEGSK